MRNPWIWVAVGLVLRLAFPEGFLFRQDEAEHLEFSQKISREGQWLREAWPSSVGVPNGPVFVYVLAGITKFSLDPRHAAWTIALLNVVALAMSVPLFRKLLQSSRETYWATAIYATSPVAIWFSRKIWDPCVLAIFTVPALWALVHVATRDAGLPKSKAVFWVPPLAALAAQVHQAGAFFAVLLLVATVSLARRISLPFLALGFLVAGALAAPYLSVLVPRVLEGGLQVSSRSPWPDIDVLTNLLMDVSGHNIIQAAGREAGRMLLWPMPPVWLVIQLLAIPFYFHVFRGFGALAKGRAFESRGLSRAVQIVVWGLPLVFLVLRVRGVAHYFLPLMPLLIALVVIGARVTPGPRWRRVTLTIPVLVCVNVASWLGFQSYLSVHRGSESYGLTYGALVQAASSVAQELRSPRTHGSTEGETYTVWVDVPRDRGPLPAQYRYVLTYQEGLPVVPASNIQDADCVLRVRWSDKPWWSGEWDEPPHSIQRERIALATAQAGVVYSGPASSCRQKR